MAERWGFIRETSELHLKLVKTRKQVFTERD